jgi:hypothetical protein
MKRTKKAIRTKAVYRMTAGGKKLKKYVSISEASSSTGIDASNISKATRGILQTAGGFHWKIAQ